MLDLLTAIKRKKLSFLAFTLVFLFFIISRIVFVGDDVVNTDAMRWYRRSNNFLTALRAHDFGGTYQHYQPGISLMWIVSTVIRVTQLHDVYSNNIPQSFEDPAYFPTFAKYTQICLVTVLALAFILTVYLVYKLAGLKASLLYGAFAATEPYLIGIDRWLHVTSLEAYFAFLAFLISFLYRKTQKRYLLAISAFFLTVAVLAKVTALLALVPIAFALVNTNDTKTSIKALTVYLLFSGVFAVILFPALAVDTKTVFFKMYSAIFSAVATEELGNAVQGHLRYTFYFFIILAKTSAVTFVLFCLTLLSLIRNGWLAFKENQLQRLTLLYLSTFFVILTLSDKKIDRYVVVMIPAILLLISLYVSRLKLRMQMLAVVLLLAHTSLVFSFYTPVFSSYYSPLLGRDAVHTAVALGIYDHSGEYYAQAAKYLYDQAGIPVLIPYGYDSFASLYSGEKYLERYRPRSYVVTSLSHLPEYAQLPCAIQKTFGPRNMQPVTYVLLCE